MNNPRLTQPEEMKTRAYVYGVEKLNGYDAWALFQACALGDLPKVKSLLAKDRRLVNAQHWYQFPIHKAVSGGHTEIVKLLEACCRNHVEIAELLLQHGANPNAGMDSCECCLRI